MSKAAKCKPNELEGYRSDIKAVQRKIDELYVPVAPIMIAEDITPEKLAVLMAEQGERIAIFSDEGGVFDIMGGRYSGGIPNLDVYLKAHSGNTMTIHRLGRDDLILHNPALSIALSPQPAVIQSLVSKEGFNDRGLLARFLYFVPKSKVGTRNYQSAPISAGTVGTYRAVLKNLLNKEFDQPHIIDLSPQAFELFLAHYNEIETAQRRGGHLYDVASWASKLHGATLRIAGIFHCAINNNPEHSKITSDTMAQAIKLTNALKSHAIATFNDMGVEPNMRIAKRIIEWIKSRDMEKDEFTFNRRDVFLSLTGKRNKIKKMQHLEQAFNILRDHRYLWFVSKNLCAVHPELFNFDNKKEV
jgi:putative DNA primase/helicase